MADEAREPLRGEEMKLEEQEGQQLVHEEQGQRSMNVVIWTRDQKGVQVDFEQDGQEALASDMFDVIHDSLKLHPEVDRSVLRRIFSMWMVSPLLTLPMKEVHKPYEMAQMWDDLCLEYVDCTAEETARDEPVIMFQRNVFLTKEDENKEVVHERLWELLYCEANQNVVDGNYIMAQEDYDKLAGIQACVTEFREGTVDDYKKDLEKYYPKHIRKQKTSILKLRQQQTLNLAHHFRDAHAHQQTKNRQLIELYMDYIHICQNYPFYGASFFEAVLAKPPSKLQAVTKYVFGPGETEVTVAINMESVCIVDEEEKDVILAVPYSDLSWQLQPAKDGQDMRCLLLQFAVKDKDKQPTHTEVLQVFSKQAKLMDALIDSCVKRITMKSQTGADGNVSESVNVCDRYCNKTNKMCLTRYTMDGVPDPVTPRKK